MVEFPKTAWDILTSHFDCLELIQANVEGNAAAIVKRKLAKKGKDIISDETNVLDIIITILG